MILIRGPHRLIIMFALCLLLLKISTDTEAYVTTTSFKKHYNFFIEPQSKSCYQQLKLKCKSKIQEDDGPKSKIQKEDGIGPIPFDLSYQYYNDGFFDHDEMVTKTQKSQATIEFSGPLSRHVMLNWNERPKRIFFLSKPEDEVCEYAAKAVKYLWDKNLEIVVEPHLYSYFQDTGLFEDVKNSKELDKSSISIYDPKDRMIDFIITFGGDGLLLHCNTLFSRQNDVSIPPVMSFDLGSLGFLAPFPYEDFEDEMDRVLDGVSSDETQSDTRREILLTLRMRLHCTIWRGGAPIDSYTVLNEAVIDRGPSPYLSVLDMTCDNQYLTTVQGDGVIIATPTGSTAYSLAAGGSIVYPSVPAILITPICAHSLSFRPMLLPDSAIVFCSVPSECRSSGMVSFDGKFRQELNRGDRLEVRASRYPMPTVNRLNYTGDWFDSLRVGFMFNLRPKQSAK